MFSVQYAVFSVQYAVSSVQCIVDSVQCRAAKQFHTNYLFVTRQLASHGPAFFRQSQPQPVKDPVKYLIKLTTLFILFILFIL